jgi:hypothetical protein
MPIFLSLQLILSCYCYYCLFFSFFSFNTSREATYEKRRLSPHFSEGKPREVELKTMQAAGWKRGLAWRAVQMRSRDWTCSKYSWEVSRWAVVSGGSCCPFHKSRGANKQLEVVAWCSRLMTLIHAPSRQAHTWKNSYQIPIAD